MAVARFNKFYQNMPAAREAEYHASVKQGYRALAIMEKRLQNSEFLAGPYCSLADISLYAYTHVAHEGGFDLTDYPAINGWLQRIEALDGYVSMDEQST